MILIPIPLADPAPPVSDMVPGETGAVFGAGSKRYLTASSPDGQLLKFHVQALCGPGEMEFLGDSQKAPQMA
jgi:hypothetical protein